MPQQLWDVTPIYLLATAGLRLLTASDARGILDACSRALAATPLAHRREWAAVIPGDAEGVFAWVAANYVTGALEVRVAATRRVARLLTRGTQSLKALLQSGGVKAILDLQSRLPQ